MKTSILLFLTDILPSKRRFLSKIIKNKLFNDLNAHEIFTQLRESKIDGIEVLLPNSFKMGDIQELKEVTKQNNVKILSVHQALRFLTITKLDEIRQLLEIAKMLSAKVVVLHMNSAGKQLFNRKYLNKIHVMQKEYGIKIGFENREKYLGSILNGYGWDAKKFGNLMNKEDLYITLDICHMGQAGGDIINFFKENKERIVNIHISDYRKHILNSSLRPIRFKHLPLGEGTLPINELLRVLKSEKYEGLLTLEINTNIKELINSAKILQNAT
jgi:sugar phosphate isomerase/epimerase